MNDKELLELTAKAAGVEVHWNVHGRHFDRRVVPEPAEPFSKWLPWRPLSDDGDALRLVRSLMMRIDFYKREVWYPVGGGRWQTIGWHLEAYKGAVVRAAAEIGRTK